MAGDYEAMGAQQVDLLGPLAQQTRQLLLGRWPTTLGRSGFGVRVADRLGLSLFARLAPLCERSGLFRELQGMAKGLHISRTNAVRMFFAGLYGGSTAFAATPTATGGKPLLGRNIDWYDEQGLLRPVLTHYCPSNGDAEYLSVGWPLVGIPIVGLNEHGLAISVNFFHADEMVRLSFPQVPYRLALQRARTVPEALALFRSVKNRGGPGLVLLADARGQIAQLECVPSACAVFEPDAKWIALANHARTPAMRQHDLGRTPDSLRRAAAMANAVRHRLGHLDRAAAIEILRDRSSSPWFNGSNVANAKVLSSVLVDPVARVLWHSTRQQPLAPYGRLDPFPVGPEASTAHAFGAAPLDPLREAAGPALRLLQRAVDRLEAREPAAAERILATLGTGTETVDPDRLAWARALARLQAGDLAHARPWLEAVDTTRAPFEISAAAQAGLGLDAQLSRKQAAAKAYFLASQAILDGHPQADAPEVIGVLQAFLDAGLAGHASIEAAQRLPAMQQVR